MSGVNLVPLSEVWLPQVMAIEAEAFGADAWSPETFCQGLKQQVGHYIAAVQGEKLLGYMGFSHIFEDIELLTVAVAKTARRSGVGRQMMAYLTDYAERHKAERILLEVRASNHAAMGLYESFGFEKIGVRKGYYHKPKEDALLYEWTGENRNAGRSPI